MSYLNPAPTLRELAERLSLIQRWNGRTTIPWTVLQHSILAATLLPKDVNPYIRLVVLLHDTAEAYTGDIQRGFKCPEQIELETELLGEIYRGLCLVAPSPFTLKSKIRYVDDVTALVEAQCICHPRERREIVGRHLEAHRPDPALVEQGEDTLWSMRDMSRHDAIDTWVQAVETLLDSIIAEDI